VCLLGGVDEVLERLHSERRLPDGAAGFQSLQDTRSAEWYREHA
jgi:hypothetical protein